MSVKETESIVQFQSFREYKANIVTYTLVYISYRTNQQLNLDIVWEKQTIQEPLPGAIRLVSVAIYKSITSASKGQNVTEWCKKEDCWKEIKKLKIDLPDSISKVLSSKK